MDIGIGLDASLRLSFEDEAEMAYEAARLGYTSIWTPETTGRDSFQVCAHRWRASQREIPTGLTTGISVVPVMYRSPVALAMSGGTLSELTGGKFILGIGAGSVYQSASRLSMGLPDISALSMMRDYLTTLRLLLAGEKLDYRGEVVTLTDVRLGIRPPQRTPIYLGSLGPKMLKLAGELADGAALNWCTPEQRAWSKEKIAEGATTSGRDPSEIKTVEYIRVCIDDDVELAREAFTKSLMPYALGARVPTSQERRMGYRAHFERIGFSDTLKEIDKMRVDGAPRSEIIEAFPPELLLSVGYYGKSEGASKALASLAQGLDTAIVRVVSARPSLASVRAVMKACKP